MDRFETVYVVLDGHGAGGPDYMDIFGSEADARSYMSGLVSSGYNENELWLTETTVKFTNNIDMTTFDFGDGKGPVAAHRHLTVVVGSLTPLLSLKLLISDLTHGCTVPLGCTITLGCTVTLRCPVTLRCSVPLGCTVPFGCSMTLRCPVMLR